MATEREKETLRELARRYREVANEPRQEKLIRRQRDINDLNVRRPAVLIDEIPWFEMDIDHELTCVCEGKAERDMETYFRRALYRHKYFPCDTVFEPLYPVAKTVHTTGCGLTESSSVIRTDEKNHIVSHKYNDIIPEPEDLEARFHLPVVTVDEAADEKRKADAEEILGDILPVVIRGRTIYEAPWDQIPRFHGGAENVLMELYDRPEFMHRLMTLLMQATESKLLQFEALGVLDPRGPTLHCTPAYVTGAPEKKEPPFRLCDMWFRSMAQLFGSVSPQMHWEFDMAYTLPLMKKCAYTYYGCCEALDNKLDLLQRIPNLRKVGCSPWADVAKMAECLGGRYVLARKPNPALVACGTDEDAVRHEITETVRRAQRYGCPTEFVLKDISTVSYRPESLMTWARVVKEVLDEFYGED